MSPDFNTLTSKQKKVYSAIESFIKIKGIPPTVREIGEMVGEKTPGAVQGILNRLEQKGVIKRELGMARSIKLVMEDSNYVNPVYIPEIKKVNKRNLNDLLSIYNIKKYQPISPDLVKSQSNLFMIDCPDSDVDENYLKRNDKVIIELDSEVNPGDITLAVFENYLLLRQYDSGETEGTLRLKSASSLIDKEVFKRDEVTIVGKMVGKFTKFE